MSSERIRGIQVHRPIIYGSHARLLTETERQLAPPGHTHRWTIFFTSAATPPPKQVPGGGDSYDDINYIPGGADDLSYLIRKVTFKLHETYPTPSRVFDKPPFAVTETGWGEFAVNIRVQFIPESGEKPLSLTHMIKLHHWGTPIEPPPTVPGGATPATTVVDSAAPTPAAGASGEVKKERTEGEEQGTPAPKEEVTTPAGEKQEGKPEASGSGGEAMDVDPSPLTPAGTNTAAGNTPAPSTPAPVSISARLPVHAWQYDELVFSDPMRNFLEILNAHPPTPLPAKSRRPRDQREEHELKKKGKLDAKGLKSLAASRRESRAGTMETPGVTPAPGQAQVGIPGEPGSADVPLEFTQEMVKGEYNAMSEARVKIVEQMDRWRERLIALEKELAKAKEDVKTTGV
ncbi:hypothetical protein IAT38_006619 [Cryptococcus sp. DSM 104549]